MNKRTPMGRNDHHIFDYSKITDMIYIGSDLCKGAFCPVHGDDFKKLGVCVEINLSAEKNEIPPENIDSYTWLPVVDGYSPTQEQLDMGTSIIDIALRNGQMVYLHCKNGHGRSPTLATAYFIRFNRKGVEEALEKIKEKRPEVHIEKVQKEALEKFAKRWLN